jgi:hypothetical protein
MYYKRQWLQPLFSSTYIKKSVWIKYMNKIMMTVVLDDDQSKLLIGEIVFSP